MRSTPASHWMPFLELDLNTTSAIAFQEAMQKFDDWRKVEPIPEIGELKGWYTITPEIAQNLLMRNAQNRKLSLEAVRKYAERMVAGVWRRTGQPILLTVNGELWDGQHRLVACLLSGVNFETYVVDDVPSQSDLFAYIDEGKPRSAADALYTAGSNGLSGSIAAAIRLAHRYDTPNALSITKTPAIRALSNIETLEYSREHPQFNQAAHLTASNYSKAIGVIKTKGVAVFVAWKIFVLYGVDGLEDFFKPLGSGANLAEDDPILHLRNRLLSAQEGDEDLKAAHRLALIIKAFNMHRAGTRVGKRGFYLRDNETYPRFEEAPLLVEAAQ